MPLNKITPDLKKAVAALEEAGTSKGAETVVVAATPPDPASGKGPRFRLAGEGGREFIRLNSNSYLGMGLRPEIIEAEEHGSRTYGAGPGAVRFISGTYAPHVELEKRLAAFHGREAAMAFSSAYATVMGIITPLVTGDTVVISDELNHNCIINAIRLSRPKDKDVYKHLDMDGLDQALSKHAGQAKRAVVITDGIFSMRGDHAPLDEVMDIARKHDDAYPENVVVVADDSHGVGAFGQTGRGTEEYTGGQVDVLVATLGKALGVNGGYVTSSKAIVSFLRETAPFYIYSNPITPGEAQAALKSVEILDGPAGRALLDNLRALTKRYEQGLVKLGYEVIPGEHPVVPLMIRDTGKTRDLVRYLYDHGVLVTGLAYPVVPRGDEEIRCQINADHTEADIDAVLELLGAWPGRS